MPQQDNDYENFENFTKALKNKNLSNHIHWTNHILIKQMAYDVILLKEKILGNGKKGLCDQQEDNEYKIIELKKSIDKIDKKPMKIIANVGIIVGAVGGTLLAYEGIKGLIMSIMGG